MNFSYYEIYITSQRAFAGMGFPYGADEDAAYMVTWLELYGLNGIEKLTNLVDKIDKKYSSKTNTDLLKYDETIDLKHTSLLINGPGLIDYFYNKTKKTKKMSITMKNCIDPFFVIPLLYRYSNKIKFINASWLDDRNIIGINLFKNKIIIGNLRDNKIRKNGEVYLNLINNNKNISKVNMNNIIIEINEKIKQKNLSKSLNPNLANWKKIEKIAKRTFVKESNESRMKGAGGGDDND